MKHLLKTTATRFLLLLLCLSFLVSCSDDKDDAPATGSVEVSVQHLVGGQPLQSHTTYTSPAGDTYAVEKLQFYLSNVKLISGDDKSAYTEPHSYHLISLEGKSSFTLTDVPAGTYTAIEFGMGVDKAHNHSIDQHGDLDPSNDMVWDWDTGYKFLNLTGTYTGNTKAGGLILHIGEDVNYKVFTLKLPQPLDLRQKPDNGLRIITELNELFQNPHLIDFDEMNTAMGGENARKIVENYSNGFFKVELDK